MDKESIDIKTAIQIAKIVVSVPEERMPIIWDIFKQAGLDIGGVDEMAEWKALTKQASLAFLPPAPVNTRKQQKPEAYALLLRSSPSQRAGLPTVPGCR